MKELLYGAAYYDEYMPYDRLDKDVEMMKKAGINTVRIAESTWSTCEPQPGVFDFSHVERVMDAMEEAGINVIIGTPTYAVPTWMVKAHPDVLAETVKGRGIYGARQIMDITHPVYGVDTTYIKKVPAQGGHTIIQVDKEGRNNIILYGGTNQMQSREYIDKVLSDFTAGDYLLLQNEINQLDYIIDKAYEKEMRIVLNPSPFDDKLDKCDFSKIYLFLLNEVEGAQFTGESQPDSMIQMFREKLPDSKAVLTLGSEGAVYFDSKVEIRQPIFKTEVIDTTAAGDTFTGFFLAGLLKGFDISETLKIASKAASIAVSRAGAVNSIPMLNEVMESFEKNEKGREREK